MAKDGRLVDDFAVDVDGRVVLVRNAPSPAATSSLAIAGTLRVASVPATRSVRPRISWTMTEARLLIVEDEPNILELLAASLRFAGFEVYTRPDGPDAVTAVQRHRPDLIVLDVMLPDLDGFEVVRRLRGGGVHMPVVFLTARDATEDKIRGLTLGGDDYVTKPFSLEEVVARIHAVLRRTSGDRPTPPPRLTFADIELDEESHEVWRGGTPYRCRRPSSSCCATS